MKSRGRLFALTLLPALYFLSALLQDSRHRPTPRIPEVPEGPPRTTAPIRPSKDATAPSTPTAGPARLEGPAPVASPAPPPASVAPVTSPAPPARQRPAQGTAELTGAVVEAAGETPLAGATASLPELKLQAATGPDGRFRLPGVPARKRPYELMVAGPGFRTVTIEVFVRKANVPVDAGSVKLTPRGW